MKVCRLGKRRVVLLVFVSLVVFSVGCAPLEAGFLDSVKSMFSGGVQKVKSWFSGGSEDDFRKMLDSVEESQASLAEKQNEILDLYSRGDASSLKADDPAFQKRLDELEALSRENERKYLELLKVRDELAGKGRDLSAYRERLGRISQTQHNLEEGWQAIQEANKDAGAFTPPSEAKGGALAAGGKIYENPEAQRYIDEYLSLVGLDEWGRLLNIDGLIVKASGDPEAAMGITRHQWVWEQLADKRSCGANLTLREYVMARLDGKNPNLVVPGRVAGTSASAPGEDEGAVSSRPVGGGGGESGSSSTSASLEERARVDGGEGDSSMSLAEVDTRIKNIIAEVQRLNQDPDVDKQHLKELLSELDRLKKLRKRLSEDAR